MNNCEDCKVIYYAFDNTPFETQEECMAYNALPKIYIIVDTSYKFEVLKVLIDRKEATKTLNLERQKLTGRRAANIKCITHTVTLPEKLLTTVHEKITNAKNKKETWWAKWFTK